MLLWTAIPCNLINAQVTVSPVTQADRAWRTTDFLHNQRLFKHPKSWTTERLCTTHTKIEISLYITVYYGHQHRKGVVRAFFEACVCRAREARYTGEDRILKTNPFSTTHWFSHRNLYPALAPTCVKTDPRKSFNSPGTVIPNSPFSPSFFHRS